MPKRRDSRERLDRQRRIRKASRTRTTKTPTTVREAMPRGDKPCCGAWLGGPSGREEVSRVKFRGSWGLHVPLKHDSSSFREATARPLPVMSQVDLTPPPGS